MSKGEQRYLRGCALEIAALQATERALRIDLLQQAAREHDGAFGVGDADDLIAGSTSWRPLVRLGTIALLVGQPQAAGDALGQAHAIAPEQRAVRLGCIEHALAIGDNVAAMQALHAQEPAPLLDSHPDGWVLSAVAAEAGGLIGQMQKLIEGAAHLLDAGFLALHRSERYDDLCALATIYDGHPKAGRGPMGQLASLMAGRTEAVASGSARAADPAMIGRALRHVLRSGRAQLITPLLDTPADAIWPGIADTVNAAIVSLAHGA